MSSKYWNEEIEKGDQQNDEAKNTAASTCLDGVLLPAPEVKSSFVGEWGSKEIQELIQVRNFGGTFSQSKFADWGGWFWGFAPTLLNHTSGSVDTCVLVVVIWDHWFLVHAQISCSYSLRFVLFYRKIELRSVKVSCNLGVVKKRFLFVMEPCEARDIIISHIFI